MSQFLQRPSTVQLPLVNTFHFLECGGNPAERPDLDYSLFYPYLLRTYPDLSLSFLPQTSLRDTISKYRQTPVECLFINLKRGLSRKNLITLSENSQQELDKNENAPMPEGHRTSQLLLDLVELMIFVRDAFNSQITGSSSMLSNILPKISANYPRLQHIQNLRELDYILPIALFEWDLLGGLGGVGDVELELKDIVRTSVFLITAGNLIKNIVANYPQIFMEVVEILVETYTRRVPMEVKTRIQEALNGLCEMAQHHAGSVRASIVKCNILAGLAVRLSLNFCHDPVTFIDGALTTKPAWLISQLAPQSQVIGLLQRRIFQTLENKLNQQPEPSSQIDLSILLRIICGFAGVLKVQYSLPELQTCLKVVSHAKSERLVKLCLCFLLVCSEMLVIQKITLEQTLSQLINSEHSHYFLLFAVYFHTSQVGQIQEVCNATLGVEVTLPQNGLRDLYQIFTRNLLSNEFLAKRALLLEPSTFSNLGVSTDPEYLSIKCFYHLLQAKIFHNSNVDIRDWMYKQILGATTPVHDRMGPLLQSYAESILDGLEKNPKHPSPITKIPEKELRILFHENIVEISPAHVLMLMYALYFNNKVHGLASLGITIPEDREAYSDELMEFIAVRRVLNFAETCDDGKAYREIYQELLSLVAANYPEIFDIASFLTDEDRWKRKVWKHTNSQKLQFSNIVDRCVQAVMSLWLDDPGTTLEALHKLESIPPPDLSMNSRTIISSALPRLLDPRTDQRILDSFNKIWDMLNSVNPGELATLTINALKVEEKSQMLETSNISWPHFLMNPIAILSVDSRVFRCPSIYKIFIKIINFYLIGTRHLFEKHYELENDDVKKAFATTNLSTMLDAQEVMMLVMILQGCRSTPSDDSQSLEVLDEIRTLTCNFLHILFNENSKLQRLVVFQGFDNELLPIMVERIESMHVCIGYLPELIAHKDRETRNFGIILASCICQKWPLRQTYAIARDLIIPKIQDIVKTKSTPINQELFDLYLAAVRTAKIFPAMKAEVQKILSDKTPFKHEKKAKISTEMKSELEKLRSFLESLQNEVEDIPTPNRYEDMELE